MLLLDKVIEPSININNCFSILLEVMRESGYDYVEQLATTIVCVSLCCVVCAVMCVLCCVGGSVVS